MMRFLLIFGFVGLMSLAFWLLLRPAPSEESLYTQLLKRCLGDDSQAARLIEYERTRSTGLDRAELIRRALRRLDRDNSR
ncbi:MAG: hypothetical protein ACXW32_02550 [Limisphaerales bacterium]